MLVWNVFLSDINKKEIIVYNIFSHYSFYNDLKEELKSNNDKEEFSKRLKRICRYYFGAKCEYEIVLTCNPEWHKFKKKTINAYSQLELNWNRFINYIWENKNNT